MTIFLRELNFFGYFFSVQFLQILPYWAFGMVIGSLISVFGKARLHTMFAGLQEKNLGLWGIVPASVIGIVSPICMYGTIPIAASLKGMRADWLAAFMMSSILLNPQIIVLSAALGSTVLVIRIVSCFLCGITAGLLVRCFYFDKAFFSFEKFQEAGGCEAENLKPNPNPFWLFLKSFLRNIKVTGPAFVIGVSLSALFQRYVPPDAVAALFGRHRAFGVLMAASIGVPLYACGGGTIPLLLAWLHSGMSIGSAAAFMISGPAMKITNLGALKIVLPMKQFIFYVVFSFAFAFFAGFLVDTFSSL